LYAILGFKGSHSAGDEELCVLRCNTVYSDEIQATLKVKILLPFSGLKNKSSSCQIHVRFLLGLLFDLEDGDNIFV
jgi:hypothetical protein